MRRALTVGVWTLCLVSLAAAGLVATLFVMMATGMDPSDIVANGTEPWTDALWATGAFVGLAVWTVVNLRLWHTARFKAVALILAFGEAGLVAWRCASVYSEYF